MGADLKAAVEGIGVALALAAIWGGALYGICSAACSSASVPLCAW